MEVHGSPGGSWSLVASTAMATTPTRLGTFLLDPAPGFGVGSGTLDAEGSVSLTFPVPDSVQLVGATVFWQALAGTPQRFTNLERTILSRF